MNQFICMYLGRLASTACFTSHDNISVGMKSKPGHWNMKFLPSSLCCWFISTCWNTDMLHDQTSFKSHRESSWYIVTEFQYNSRKSLPDPQVAKYSRTCMFLPPSFELEWNFGLCSVLLHRAACTNPKCAKYKNHDESLVFLWTVIEIMDRRSKTLYSIKLDLVIFTYLCQYDIDICLILPSIFQPRTSSKYSFSFHWFCNGLTVSSDTIKLLQNPFAFTLGLVLHVDSCLHACERYTHKPILCSVVFGTNKFKWTFAEIQISP